MARNSRLIPGSLSFNPLGPLIVALRVRSRIEAGAKKIGFIAKSGLRHLVFRQINTSYLETILVFANRRIRTHMNVLSGKLVGITEGSEGIGAFGTTKVCIHFWHSAYLVWIRAICESSKNKVIIR